jgi:hypothetical protein
MKLNTELDLFGWDGENPISIEYRCTELVLTNKGYRCPEARGVRGISNISSILFRLINLSSCVWI